MNEKIKRLDVDANLKRLAISFIDEIKNIDTTFVLPVIGDFIIDRYRYCKVERKNLEHDSLIHDLIDSSCFYGGAANVANILGTFSSSLINTSVKFFIGAGIKDYEYLDRINLSIPDTFTLNVYVDQLYDTIIPVKTRYIGVNRNEYLFRVDTEPSKYEFSALSDSIVRRIVTDISKLNSDVLFVSDYNKGFISDTLLDYLNRSNSNRWYCNIRPKLVNQYIDKMYLLSFNKTEFIKAYEILFGEVLDVIVIDNITRFKDYIKVPNMIITFGANGFIFCDENNYCTKVESFQKLSINSKNIIGAGDSCFSAFGFFDAINSNFFLDKYSMDMILYLVNCVTFLKVYTGNYTVSFDLLKSYINGNLCLF